MKQKRHVVVGLCVSLFLLNGCQPNDTLSAVDAANNQAVVSGVNNVTDNSSSNADFNVSPNANLNASACQNETVVNAFKAQQSDRQVKGCGTIIKALLDDTEGSRHQKILIELEGVSPKQTLLLVHNIDLAPRVANVSRGTVLSFYGEYVYNDKGGLVHWTHHDPAARHQGGWIDSGGVRYE